MKDNSLSIITLFCALFALVLALTSLLPISYNELTDLPILSEPESSVVHQLNLFRYCPLSVSIASLSPTAHGADKVRLFPFEISFNITVNLIKIRVSGNIANCLILGIFNETGSNIWVSDVLSPSGSGVFLSVSYNLPITLENGIYYFATTNNNVVNANAAYSVVSLTASFMPRWGYVATVNGTMPNSINVESITEDSIGFSMFTVFLDWTT